MFRIKARSPFSILFLQVQFAITNIFENIARNMQVESSATPLLMTEDKASSLPGQLCPFHPRMLSRCMTRADCRLQTANCSLQTADCRLQTADCRLHKAARL